MNKSLVILMCAILFALVSCQKTDLAELNTASQSEQVAEKKESVIQSSLTCWGDPEDYLNKQPFLVVVDFDNGNLLTFNCLQNPNYGGAYPELNSNANVFAYQWDFVSSWAGGNTVTYNTSTVEYPAPALGGNVEVDMTVIYSEGTYPNVTLIPVEMSICLDVQNGDNGKTWRSCSSNTVCGANGNGGGATSAIFQP